ncbi:hypothetical protein GCM10027298_11920 [Epidermidibacterium keratini]
MCEKPVVDQTRGAQSMQYVVGHRVVVPALGEGVAQLLFGARSTGQAPQAVSIGPLGMPFLLVGAGSLAREVCGGKRSQLISAGRLTIVAGIRRSPAGCR